MSFIDSLMDDRAKCTTLSVAYENGVWSGCNGRDVTAERMKDLRKEIAELDAAALARKADWDIRSSPAAGVLKS